VSGAIVAVADGIELTVRLTPAGGADKIEGLATDSAGQIHLKARVRAAPEDGKANAALEALIAKALGRPKSAAAVVRGAKSRLKIVRVTGDPTELMAKAAALTR
jgi:uncharacterized protein YggU (UPF0235/DUF167 family)